MNRAIEGLKHLFTSPKDLQNIVTPSERTVHVLRIQSPVELRILLASGVREIEAGESLLQFRNERAAVQTAWLVQDAALVEKTDPRSISLTLAKAHPKTGITEERPVPSRNPQDVDPRYFLPDALGPDEEDLSDWMYGVHWEDTELTAFICDNAPSPDADVKVEKEWMETIGKLTYLVVEQKDNTCRLCGGSGVSRCSRCNGAAAMALPGSTFKCICKMGAVPCAWCAGDGLMR